MKTSRVVWIVECFDDEMPRDEWDPVSMPFGSREAARRDARERRECAVRGLHYRVAKYVRDVNA